MDKKPKLTIVIPAYNEEKYISKCIENILIAKKGGYIDEIIVIDNNSTDNTSNIVRQYSDIKLLLEKKQGTNAARQKGYIESKSDLIAFIDADCQMPENRPEKVVNIFLKNPDVGILTGGYLYHDGNWIQNFYAKFTRYIRVPIVKFISGYIGNGGNMVVRKNIFDKIGGFNTDMDLYGDDIDTARRVSNISKCDYSTDIIIPTSYRRFNGAGFLNANLEYFKSFYHGITGNTKHELKNKSYR